MNCAQTLLCWISIQLCLGGRWRLWPHWSV